MTVCPTCGEKYADSEVLCPRDNTSLKLYHEIAGPLTPVKYSWSTRNEDKKIYYQGDYWKHFVMAAVLPPGFFLALVRIQKELSLNKSFPDVLFSYDGILLLLLTTTFIVLTRTYEKGIVRGDRRKFRRKRR